MKQEPKDNTETSIAAMRYIMLMLLQRLDGAGQISLQEMIAGVEGDQAATALAHLPAHSTFDKALELLRLAEGYKSNHRV